MVYVRPRPYKKNGIVKGWEVDITIHFADGLPPHRVRKKSPMRTEKQSIEWGHRLGVTLAKQGRPDATPQPPAPPPSPLFKDFVKTYLRDWVLEQNSAPSTYRLREQELERYFMPRFGELRLTDITAERIAELRASLRLTQWGTLRGAKQKNSIICLLGHMLQKAKDWGLLSTPLPKLPERAKQPKTEIEIYTDEELDRLLAAAEGAHHLMILLGCDAGLRVAEMMGLRWSDLDLKQRRMMVRQQDNEREVTSPKGKEPRPIPLSRRLAAALKGAKHLGERVLVSREGVPVARKEIAKWLRRIEKKAGVISKSPHKLRHSFASRLLRSGAPMTAVQALLGHRSMATTLRYLHLHPGDIEAAIEKLSGEMPEKKQGEEET